MPLTAFETGAPKPDFETDLGAYLVKWVKDVGIDRVIEGLDFYVHTFELCRDVGD